MSKTNPGNYKKNLKDAYKHENKAFKHWDKGNYLQAAKEFKEAARLFEIAYEASETLDQKVLTSSNKYVELSNHYWVLALKKYVDEEDYYEAAEIFKKAISSKRKALELDKDDVELRKTTGGKDEAKRKEWRTFQHSTLRELYAYYFLSLGLYFEQKKRYKEALEQFENAAANYKQQIRYLASVKKPTYLVRQFLLKTYLRIGETKRILGKTKEAMKIYQTVIKEVRSLPKRHQQRALPIVALAEAELAEVYKSINQLSIAANYYWKFLNWAKKINLEEEQGREVARVICILTIINIKQGKVNQVDRA
ncbi:MAG: hypothetical protein ACTSQY_03495, partial [Candidatus Odinarchaeia archaeon]